MYSTVPSTSSHRIDHIRRLALDPGNGVISTMPLLTSPQVRCCQNAIHNLLRKLNSSGRSDRLVIDKEQISYKLINFNLALWEGWRAIYEKIDDDTRVILKSKENGLSYINANYVVDSTQRMLPKFIATQGPLPNTYVDFWEMVVQQHCPVIVMLTDLVDKHTEMVKCGNYFPAQEEQSQTHGRFKITNRSTIITENAIEQRLLEIEILEGGGSAPIPVLHLHMDWPDYGVPESTISVRAIFRTLYNMPSSYGPFVVHCSAGIGRTGTYCVIDHTLRRILEGDSSAVHIENTVCDFRMQRFGMVQTRKQYAFCHSAVIAELQDLITSNGGAE